MEDPTFDVGTELLFENEVVRVWSMKLEPGERSPFHSHVHDYVYAYVTPSRITSLIPGDPPVTSEYQDGYVRFVNVASARPHRIQNVGSEPHRQIIVELKQASTVLTSDNGRKQLEP